VIRGDAIFDVVARNTSDLIVVAGLDGIATYISPACARLTGYEADELMGALGSELIHADDRARLLDLWRALPISDACTPAWRLIRKDGRCVWIESTVNVIRDSATAQAIGVVMISRNVSKRKREDKTDVMEAASNAMIMMGSDGLIAFVNTQTEKLFGITSRSCWASLSRCWWRGRLAPITAGGAARFWRRPQPTPWALAGIFSACTRTAPRFPSRWVFTRSAQPTGDSCWPLSSASRSASERKISVSFFSSGRRSAGLRDIHARSRRIHSELE